ncbi:Hypothetical predicted protein, partial [Pelobates cultripes]
PNHQQIAVVTENVAPRISRKETEIHRRKRGTAIQEEKKQEKNVEGIFNLTEQTLSAEQTEILSKGLKFAPTTDFNKFDFFIDVNHFIRRLSLKKFFFRKEQSAITLQNKNYVHIDLREKSTFFPKHMISDQMKAFEIIVMKEVDTITKTTMYQQNLSRREQKTLKGMEKDNNTIIKPADKGGGIVIFEKDQYIKEAERILLDPKTYQ